MDHIKGSKLVIPTVSYANVPQLAADLLIKNLDAIKVAALDDKFLYPFVSGNDPVLNGKEEFQAGISTGLDVYYSDTHKTTVLHQRAPILSGYQINFIKEVLLPFISKISPQDLTVLGSLSLADYRSEEKIKFYKPNEFQDDQFIVKFCELCKVDVSIGIIHVYEGDNFQDAVDFYTEISHHLKVAPNVGKKLVLPYSWSALYGDKPVPVSMEEGLFA